jgi:hypothetical protein
VTGRDVQDSSHDVSQNSRISVKQGSVLCLPIRWGTAAARARARSRSVRLSNSYPGFRNSILFKINQMHAHPYVHHHTGPYPMNQNRSTSRARYSTRLLKPRPFDKCRPRRAATTASQYPLTGRPHITLKRPTNLTYCSTRVAHHSYSEIILSKNYFPICRFTGGAGISRTTFVFLTPWTS